MIEQFTCTYERQIDARMSQINKRAAYSYVAKINKFEFCFIFIVLIWGLYDKEWGSLGNIFCENVSMIFCMTKFGPTAYMRFSWFIQILLHLS